MSTGIGMLRNVLLIIVVPLLIAFLGFKLAGIELNSTAVDFYRAVDFFSTGGITLEASQGGETRICTRHTAGLWSWISSSEVCTTAKIYPTMKLRGTLDQVAAMFKILKKENDQQIAMEGHGIRYEMLD